MVRYYGRRRPPRVKTAVALEYERGKDRAPSIAASGRGDVAEKIIKLAKERGIYIQPDPDLAEILAELDVGEAIPPQLYYVVAEVLAFVYNLNAAHAPKAG